MNKVLDIQILSNENAIKDILLVAHGEEASEEILKQVSELWG